VKKGLSVNQAGAQLEADALRILREIPGLKVTPRPKGGDGRPDFLVSFGGGEAPVAIEVKRHANAATAWQLLRQADEHPAIPLLVIANDTTAEARRLLAEHGVGLVDGLGNAHLELSGLLVHLEARRQPRRDVGGPPPTRLRGKAGLAAEALLLEPKRPWRVQDLAELVGVSTGLAHRVLRRLEAEGLLEAEGGGPNRVRRLVDPGALLDLWAEESLQKPRRTMTYVLAQSPQQLVAGVGTSLEKGGLAHAVTGAAAASLIAPFVTAVPVIEVWVTERAAPQDLYECVRGEPVTDGQNVVLLQERGDTPLRFRDRFKSFWVANRFQIYVDLRRDPRRGKEQAENLRQEVIGF
jgi:hypothetical protein